MPMRWCIVKLLQQLSFFTVVDFCSKYYTMYPENYLECPQSVNCKVANSVLGIFAFQLTRYQEWS